MKIGELDGHKNDFLKFLGTAGARFVVSKQLRASGGLWLSVGQFNIIIDPGPGSLVKCFSSKPKLDPASLNGIILTHRHLDHSNDVNILIEAITNGGREKKGFLLAPRDALEGNDPVVQLYLRHFLSKIDLLEENKTFHFPTFSMETSVKHDHPVETYGLKFTLPYGKVFLISDTAFFPELIEHYQGADILIINVVIFEVQSDNKIFHLNFQETKKLIQGIKPKVAVLTHFGMTMLQHKPHLLAFRLQDELGIKVIAAGDGLKLSLPSFFSAYVE